MDILRAMTTATNSINPLVKLAIEFGPLAAFLLAYFKAGIFWATGVFMVAITIAVAAAWILEKRVPVMPLVTGIFVLIFGGVTLYLQDEFFFKIKPTVVNTLFGLALLTGYFMKRYFLRNLLGHAMNLQMEGWRKLTIRWIFFFFALAVLNEIVWRNFSTDAWVNFKVFGIMPLTMIFMAAQFPLIKRYFVEDEAGAD